MFYGCSGIQMTKKSSIKISFYNLSLDSLSLDSQHSKELYEAYEFTDSLLCNAYGFKKKNMDSLLIELGVDSADLKYQKYYFKENTKLGVAASLTKKNKIKITFKDRQFWFVESKYFKEMVRGIHNELEEKFGKDRVE